MKMHSLLVAAIAASLPLSGSKPATPDPDQAILGPMADVLLQRVGKWRVRAELRFSPGARPQIVAALAENRLVGGRWLVSELKSDDGMNGFHGIGVNGYDPARGKYVGYWIDSSRGQLIPVEGSWDEGSRTFRTTSLERRRDGSMITVSSETRADAAGGEVTQFTVPDEKGRPFTRMTLTYRRAGGATP